MTTKEYLKQAGLDSFLDRIYKFQERYLKEDGFGNWKIKEGCSDQYYVIEELLDYLEDNEIKDSPELKAAEQKLIDLGF